MDDGEVQVGKDVNLLNNDDDDEIANNSSQLHSIRPIQHHTKFNISPNRPNANTAARLELKSIERPRSHSPNLKSKIGIDQYVELYNKTATTETTAPANKITMNLKMDDLLASVTNKNVTGGAGEQYQALDDFSFMTGDQDEPICYTNSNNVNQACINASSHKKKSIEEGGLQSYNTGNSHEDEENDADTEENEGDSSAGTAAALYMKENDAANLKYKFTATYRKDEATGSFREKSQMVFETNKIGGGKAALPLRPTKPPAYRPPLQNLPSPSPLQPPPPPVLTKDEEEDEESSNFNPDPNYKPARDELSSFLASLKSQSEKLDYKIEHEDDITPSANTYVDLTSIEAAASLSSKQKTADSSFFNDVLGKSSDLLAQTQQKLDRLAKLETVVKPLGPILTSNPVVVKARPQPTNRSDAPPPPLSSSSATLPSPSATTSIGVGSNLTLSASITLNNSKSLIDLKNDQQQQHQQASLNSEQVFGLQTLKFLNFK